jgi:hypothetical protein
LTGLRVGTQCTIDETSRGRPTVGGVTQFPPVFAVSPGTVEHSGVPNGPVHVTIGPGANESVTVTVTDEYEHKGTLVVKKVFAGNAKGDHGGVTISIDCGAGHTGTITVAPGVTSGNTLVHRLTGLRAGTVCTIDETSRGTPTVGGVTQFPPVFAVSPGTVEHSGVPNGPVKVTIGTGKNGAVTVTVTDEYEHKGTLLVKKVFAGNAKGDHGGVTISIDCGAGHTGTITVAPGVTSGPTLSHRLTGLRAGTVCTIDETSRGTPTVGGVTQLPPVFAVSPRSVSHTGVPSGPVKVTIGTGRNGVVTVTVTDEYEHKGTLLVKKVFAGNAKGDHGGVTIHISCTDGQTGTITVAPGVTSGPTLSHRLTGLRAGTVCTIDETSRGTPTVGGVTEPPPVFAVSPRSVSQTGVPNGPVKVTIGTGKTGAVTVTVTDKYTHQGTLTVEKLFAGNAKGDHGGVTIDISCDNGKTGTITVAPGDTTGPFTHTLTGLRAGTVCTINETSRGTPTVGGVTESPPLFAVSPDTVTHSGVPDGPVKVTIGTGNNGAVTVTVTDTYAHQGTLTVEKLFAGDAKGDHGGVTIHIDCSDGQTGTLTIAPGQTTGALSHTLTGLRVGTECTITETQGAPVAGAVAAPPVFAVSPDTVTHSGVPNGPVKVTIGTGDDGAVTVEITDTYTHAPGELIVTKTITGAAAGQQGAIVISVTCGGHALPDFTIAAGAPAGSTSHTYTNIPAHTVCMVIETINGHTSEVSVAVTGGGQVTVPRAGTATMGLTDTVTHDPRTLVVNKTMTGSAAGHQGAITIQVECNGTRLPDFTIPAGAAAGTVSHTYSGLPAGATCTVTETGNGHTSTVRVATTGNHQHVTLPAGGGTADLVDTYTRVHRPPPPPPKPPPPVVTGLAHLGATNPFLSYWWW